MEHSPQDDDRNGPVPTVEHEPAHSVPRIYVASLSDYNAGRLHGEWLDAAEDSEALMDGVSLMLSGSREPWAEEWAIHDYEGFGSLHLSEYEPLSIVSALAKGIAEHGPAFGAWASFVDKDPERLPDFDEAYQGEWDSLTAYAENLVEDIGLEAELDKAVSGSLRPYVTVDYEVLARDMEISGDIYSAGAENGAVYVFWAQ